MRSNKTGLFRPALIVMAATAMLTMVAGCADTGFEVSFSNDGGGYSASQHPYTAGSSGGFGNRNASGAF